MRGWKRSRGKRSAGGEDYELGIRLIKAGVGIAVAANALAYHHDSSDLHRSCLRKRQEGRADVLMARRHPDIVQVLRLAQYESSGISLRRILRKLAFCCSIVGDMLAAFLGRGLNLFERMRLRSDWRRILAVLQHYWYWRGVAEELGSVQALRDLLRNGSTIPVNAGPRIELDLCEGLEAAKQRLDRERPIAVRLRYGKHLVGVISPQPSAEALRGAHLDSILLEKTLAVPWLKAMALEGAITPGTEADRLKLCQAIGSMGNRIGPMDPSHIWHEEYSQWNHLKTEESDEERHLREHWDLYSKLAHETAWLEEERISLEYLAKEQERTTSEQQPRSKVTI